MLKFTKYGRTASTGNFPISSQKEKPPVVLTSFKGASAKSSSEKNEPETSNAEEGSSKPILTFVGPKTYLQRSKVSKEELIELDSKFDEKLSKVGSKNHHFRNSDSVDGNKMCKESKKCTTTSSLRTGGSMRGLVSVYNDGYFPKVQPKYFTMKRSQLLSRKAPASAVTHA